ncbi:MAG: PEGA domain-containing protein [Gemmatimonadota bacterium]|nr:MAG: PEGA domain-containing protein [Gemmatimonadota bacterium]
MTCNRRFRRATTVSLLAALLGGCLESRDRPTVPILADLVVFSDPAGAAIILDRQPTGATTPATLTGVPVGEHELELELAVGQAEFFGWEGTVEVREGETDTARAALEGGCRADCPFLIERGRIGCRSTSNGETCASVFSGSRPGLEWPLGSGLDYGAGGRLLVAGIVGDDGGSQRGDTLSTQVFGIAWTGRKPVETSAAGARQVQDLAYWSTARFPAEALQGLLVKQTLVAVDSAGVRDVVFARFEIQNVSADPLYRAIYSWIPADGLTYESLYIGFGLDADVGVSEDDLGTFDPALNLSFLYDADFEDSELGNFSQRPALVGLVTVEAPAPAQGRTLTLWRREDDWDEGIRHGFAWRLLAGRLAPGDGLSDHPSAEIGYVSNTPADYRITESHGPLRLAPGESTTLTVALLLAEPGAGTFTPGVLVEAGDPTAGNRQILEIAAGLRQLAAQVPELWDRYRP